MAHAVNYEFDFKWGFIHIFWTFCRILSSLCKTAEEWILQNCKTSSNCSYPSEFRSSTGIYIYISSIHCKLPSPIFAWAQGWEHTCRFVYTHIHMDNTCVLLFVYNVIVYARTLLSYISRTIIFHVPTWLWCLHYYILGTSKMGCVPWVGTHN